MTTRGGSTADDSRPEGVGRPGWPTGAAAAAALLWAGAVGAQESFTIDEVMSAPFPSGLAAAPDAPAVAWIQNNRGVRNVWFARGPEYRGRRVTGYEEDDGQPLSDARVVPGAERIVYVRGGAPNRRGEAPNPRSLPREPERALWSVPVSGGEAVRLGEGHSPAISPDGERVAFLRDGEGGIWTAPADGSSEPERLLEARGGERSPRWSPDGSRLAFVSDRGDHAFVGVYDLSSEEITWLDPALARDGDPVWSPAGDRVAFLRIPPEDRIPFRPRREAIPWSIRVADPETGEGRAVWRAEPGRGSAFRGVVGADLHWAAGDRLVFPWERSGWLHLYSVPVAGGAATHLTPGAFEVQHVAVAPDGEEIVYSSNQGDVDRRHLWRVAAAGGEPEPLTPGEGIEWSPVVLPGSGHVAFLASDARTPAHAVVLTPDRGRERLAPGTIPSDFPGDRLVEPRQVVFPASDGLRIHGQLFLPRGLRPGERAPAVLFFHGGSRRQMLLGWHYRGYYHNAYALNQYLAGRGYVVLSVNYRSGIGYGLEFREAEEYGAAGASEFRDVMGAGLYLASRPEVDPARIGLWGGSYGGYLTALGLARASDLFAAGVDLHGVHDWNVVIRNFVPSYDPARRDSAARLARRSSPVADLADWRSPVLLIHGDDDRNVPFSESVDLARELRSRGVRAEELVFPDEVHGFLLHESWLRAYRTAADFFERELKGR